MITFDMKNNNKGLSQGTYHIQGMDLKLLVELFNNKFLEDNMAPDFLEYIVQVVDNINNENSIYNKKFLLRESHKFGIEFSELDNKFKVLIMTLLSKEVLYSKTRLSSIQKEQLSEYISKVLELDPNNKTTNIFNKEMRILSPRFNYEVESIEFAKFVIDKIEEYYRLGEIDYCGNGKKMVDIIELLQAMGAGINESIVLNNTKNNQEIKLTKKSSSK